jgi:alcohol dehydrogenase (cytochrome c)
MTVNRTQWALGALALTLIVASGYGKNSDSIMETSDALAATIPGSKPHVHKKNHVGATETGNAAHGKMIFGANCSACHGVIGTEGGVGPSLKGEKKKKNQSADIAWNKNPKAPMPKLYPSPLSAKDVRDVAAYVDTL